MVSVKGFTQPVAAVASGAKEDRALDGFREFQPDVDLAAVGTTGALGHEWVTVGAWLGAWAAAMPADLVDVNFDWFGQADAFAGSGDNFRDFGNPGASVFVRVGFGVAVKDNG